MSLNIMSQNRGRGVRLKLGGRGWGRGLGFGMNHGSVKGRERASGKNSNVGKEWKGTKVQKKRKIFN